MHRLLLHIISFLITASVLAQTPCFKAYNSTGAEISTFCVGQEVTFQDCNNVVPDDQEYYVFDYKSGSPIPSTPSTTKKHIYTTPGKYRVLHIGNYGGTTLTDTVTRVFEVKYVTMPTFNVKACASNKVIVTITDTQYDSYAINYGDGKTAVEGSRNENPAYQYASQGSYRITVSGSFTGASCIGSNTEEVTLLPPAKAPTLQKLQVNTQSTTGEIQFSLSDLQQGYIYIIERWQNPRTNFQKIDTIKNFTSNSITHTVKNVNTDEGVWYLVRVADACGSNIINSNSKIISSIALEVTAGNEQATLNWQAMPSAETYEVYRNNNLIATLNNSTTDFTDKGLTCGQTYTYHVQGIAPDKSTSISATKNIVASSTIAPNAPYLLASYNLDNQVEISIRLPQNKVAQTIDIQKSVKGAAFQQLSSSKQTTFTDALEQPEAICYQANFTDLCNNTSPISNKACPILLKATRAADGSVQLTWTQYQSFPNGVAAYMVELLDENGNVVANYNTTGTNYTDRALSNTIQVLRYRIKATAASSNDVSYSNTEQIEQDLQLHIPSAFTPNGDGLNDEFEIKGSFINSYNLKIYNSMGTVVFQTSDPNAKWNGTYQGKALPTDAYAYEIIVKTEFGATKRRTGTVTLLR